MKKNTGGMEVRKRLGQEGFCGRCTYDGVQTPPTTTYEFFDVQVELHRECAEQEVNVQQ